MKGRSSRFSYLSRTNTSPLQLVKKGANVNADSSQGFSPLIVAAASGHLEQVDFLISSGAALEAEHSEGVTALMYAAASGHLPCVKALVKAGATVDAKHTNGGTALTECSASSSEKNAEVVSFLLSKGADRKVVGESPNPN